jgi:malonyl-CoA O-methyltransferase
MTDSTDKSRMRHAFDRAAADFANAAFLHDEIRSRLLQRLSMIRIEPDWVLDLGTATGAGARALAEYFPGSSIVGLDWSMNMLNEFGATRAENTQQKGKPSNNAISPLCADATQLPISDEAVDLVFSNLLLQNCHDPMSVLSEVHRVLRYPGLILFTTLGPDSLQELRQAWRDVDPYTHIAHFTDMHDLGDALIHAGFAEPVMTRDSLQITYSSLTAAIADLRAVGSINATEGRNRALTSRRIWARLAEAYERFRNAEKKLPVSIEIIYGLAWSGRRRTGSVNTDGEFEIPVDDLALRSRK